MSTKPKRLKLPSRAHYHEATIAIDQRNPDIFEFVEVIGDNARALPRDLLITLGLLARRGIPDEENRPSRLKACRALAYGASLAAILGETVHEWPGVINEIKGFDVDGFEGETPEDRIFEMHGVIAELAPSIGESTVEWLRNRADNTAMVGQIGENHREWFVIGAAQIVAILYTYAVAQNR